MLSIEQIEEWLGQEVLDSAGERLGKLQDVYYSSQSGEPVLVAIKSGLLGRHVDLAPLLGGSVGRDHVRLAYTRAQIEEADVRGGQDATLDEHDTAELSSAYGIEPTGGGLESASSINARRDAAREAEEQATALEQEARERKEDAEDARGSAQDASSRAGEKETEAERAAAAAEQARAEAQRVAPQRPS